MRKTQSAENLPEISSWLIGLTLMSANQINLKKASSFENTKGFLKKHVSETFFWKYEGFLKKDVTETFW